MKVQARTNGNVVDLPDETAHELIARGIYDAVEVQAEPPPPRKKPHK